MKTIKSTELKATFIGGIAVLLWAVLATLTKFADRFPPFQLTSMSFAIAFFIGWGWWIFKKRPFGENFLHPPKVWLNGVFGLFGYHLFYFIALSNAPAAEASLIAYLWPLLIVIFSTLLPNESFHWYHFLGTLFGFGGASLIFSKSGGLHFENQFLMGYLAALICAFTWSIYSVLSRKFGNIPTESVGSFCLITSLLSLICHFLWEETVIPNLQDSFTIFLLGVGPIGIAFFTWDYGMKRGNIQALGAFAYVTPLLSILTLSFFGFSELTWSLGLACFFIMAGAFLAAGDFFPLLKNQKSYMSFFRK